MARSELTVLGQGTRVRGRILGGQDLEIHGHVEGEIEASGEVVIGPTGTVGADLQSARIIVRGAVRGDLVATESVHLEDGARVVGDVRAPRIAIARGALLKGYVQTGAAGASKPRPAARVAAAPAARVAAAPAARLAPPPPAAKKAPPPQPKSAPATAPRGTRRGEKAVVTLAGARVAPKPVVPVLKKGAKGTLAKKRG